MKITAEVSPVLAYIFSLNNLYLFFDSNHQNFETKSIMVSTFVFTFVFGNKDKNDPSLYFTASPYNRRFY